MELFEALGLVRNLHHVIRTLRGRGAPQLAWVPTGARIDKILSRFECFRLIPSLRTTNVGIVQVVDNP